MPSKHRTKRPVVFGFEALQQLVQSKKGKLPILNEAPSIAMLILGSSYNGIRSDVQ